MPVRPALRASIGIARSAWEDPPEAVSATQRMSLSWDRMKTESVIIMRRGLCFFSEPASPGRLLQ